MVLKAGGAQNSEGPRLKLSFDGKILRVGGIIAQTVLILGEAGKENVQGNIGISHVECVG
jgi:hypothetical protein